jgi:hypothetical protein
MEDVSANLLFQFFDILKYVKYVFQNIESIGSEEPKHFVPLIVLVIRERFSFFFLVCTSNNWKINKEKIVEKTCVITRASHRAHAYGRQDL